MPSGGSFLGFIHGGNGSGRGVEETSQELAATEGGEGKHELNNLTLVTLFFFECSAQKIKQRTRLTSIFNASLITIRRRRKREYKSGSIFCLLKCDISPETVLFCGRFYSSN